MMMMMMKLLMMMRMMMMLTTTTTMLQLLDDNEAMLTVVTVSICLSLSVVACQASHAKHQGQCYHHNDQSHLCLWF
jgi:uncharacterized membrane protein